MTPETLAALKGSIEKWRKIVDGTGKDEGPKNCPLCQTFRVWDESSVDCTGCPVKERTGRDGCDGSPYYDWEDAEDDSADEREAAARAELEFLRSLLPADENGSGE
jgi:hypothetical protein